MLRAQRSSKIFDFIMHIDTSRNTYLHILTKYMKISILLHPTNNKTLL